MVVSLFLAVFSLFLEVLLVFLNGILFIFSNFLVGFSGFQVVFGIFLVLQLWFSSCFWVFLVLQQWFLPPNLSKNNFLKRKLTCGTLVLRPTPKNHPSYASGKKSSRLKTKKEQRIPHQVDLQSSIPGSIFFLQTTNKTQENQLKKPATQRN